MFVCLFFFLGGGRGEDTRLGSVELTIWGMMIIRSKIGVELNITLNTYVIIDSK